MECSLQPIRTSLIVRWAPHPRNSMPSTSTGCFFFLDQQCFAEQHLSTMGLTASVQAAVQAVEEGLVSSVHGPARLDFTTPACCPKLPWTAVLPAAGRPFRAARRRRHCCALAAAGVHAWRRSY